MARVKRRAIIVRTPIILNAPTFHTIAAHSDKYENAHTMGVYPDIETARRHYQEDMDKYRGEYKHFAIRKVMPERSEDNESNI